MTITQLKYFVEVADCLNFTKAAEKMYVSQQVISKQIKNMEEEIGFALFKRDKRSVVLTEGGKLFYELWAETFEKYDRVMNKAHAVMKGKEQIIRIGTIDVSRIHDWITGTVTQLCADHQAAQFRVSSGSYLQLIQGLINDRYDCIISLKDENRDLPETIEELVVYRSFPKLILSENHPAYHEGVTVKEMADYPLYTFSPRFSRNAMKNVMDHCLSVGIEPRQIEEFDEISSLEMALHDGQGFAMTYDLFIRNPVGKLKVVDVLKEVPDNSMCSFSIAYEKSKKKLLTPFIQAFRNRFEEQTPR